MTTIKGIYARDAIFLATPEGTGGDKVFRQACSMGLEGIIAKRRDRHYRSGRSTDWIKVKNPNAPAAIRIIEG